MRLYAAPAPPPPRSSIHVLPNDVVATVELGGRTLGSVGGGAARVDLGAGVRAGHSQRRSAMDPAAATELLWSTARGIDPRLFDLASADVVQLIRWEHAVPIVGPGYHRRLASLQQRPPVVFAGDWLVQPCVEGAVRSGEAAAAALLS